MKRPRVFIGIDGSMNNCGMAWWRREDGKGVFEGFRTTDFWNCIEALDSARNESIIRREYLLVVIEDPAQNKPVFARKGVNPQAMLKIAQNVGMVKAATELIVQYCERKGIAVEKVRPTKKSMTKLTAEKFKALTGCDFKTNEHTRDAAMIVYQR